MKMLRFAIIVMMGVVQVSLSNQHVPIEGLDNLTEEELATWPVVEEETSYGLYIIKIPSDTSAYYKLVDRIVAADGNHVCNTSEDVRESIKNEEPAFITADINKIQEIKQACLDFGAQFKVEKMVKTTRSHDTRQVISFYTMAL